jgi:hypothetical protein
MSGGWSKAMWQIKRDCKLLPQVFAWKQKANLFGGLFPF